MARDTTMHVCSACGHSSPQWHGRCPGCEAWGTLVEEYVPVTAASPRGRRGSSARASGQRASALAARGEAATPRPLREVATSATARLSTGIGELDRVLGGGLVPGSLVLLGGSPGIGKSTLTNMALGNLASAGYDTLYVSGEESAEQVRLRAERLVLDCVSDSQAPDSPASDNPVSNNSVSATPASNNPALEVPILAETDLDVVLDTLATHAPQVCVIDSVQTLRASDLSGAPGSVGQVREVTGRIMELAKERGIAVVLVGHVTKDGALAGPRVLEHLVDCVLQFAGESERPYRELRALKNRFGSTNESGLFEMRQGGLVEVLDASARFVAEATRAPGSVVLAAMEGSRPLLVEVQALVAPSELEQPRRVVSGLDRNRVALVLAILGRHGGVSVAGCDVFVNVVGGVRVDEPGCDLAVALAVASAARGVPITCLASDTPASVAGDAPAPAPISASASASGVSGTPRACFGELGLTGELRWVGHPERRLREAVKHGLSATIAPAQSGDGACEAATLREALAAALSPNQSLKATNRPDRLAA